jgi:ABC-type multidrug transport system ATPase subunit
MIRVSELTKSDAARRSIAELTFEARQGGFLGFPGPSGAGKAATMRILAGCMTLHERDGRSRRVRDVVDESREVRRRVG